MTYDFRFCWLVILVELHGSVDLEFLIEDSRWHLITEQSLLGVGLLRASRPAPCNFLALVGVEHWPEQSRAGNKKIAAKRQVIYFSLATCTTNKEENLLEIKSKTSSADEAANIVLNYLT